MNIHIRAPAAPRRHKITREEYHAMCAAGVFPPGLELELIDGELIEMAGDGWRTIDWNAVLVAWLIRTLSEAYLVVPDKSLGVTEHNEPKPDIWIFDADIPTKDVLAKDTLLVIEVSDSTLRADLKKAEIYALGGVREYWVVDTEARVVLVHRLPEGAQAYPPPRRVGEHEAAEALLIPGLAFRIADHPRLKAE